MVGVPREVAEVEGIHVQLLGCFFHCEFKLTEVVAPEELELGVPGRIRRGPIPGSQPVS